MMWLLGLIFLSIPTLIKAADDQECLLCDMAIGAAVAVCEGFATCRAFMFVVGAVAIFISVLMCICGGSETRQGMWSSTPSYRRVGATALGYGLGRTVIRGR
jgi:hypothetical protein